MKRSDGVEPSNDLALTPTEAATKTARVTEPELPDRAAANAPGYQLGEVIGRGGMGEVINAHDPEIGRDVALKRLRGDATEDAINRFLREAKIQARLDHPAIVPVHEVGRDTDGMPYFTMKRLSGTTLAGKLASGTEKLQPLLRTVVDVCLAIELAHTRRVVHRDLKPQNIMVGDYGEVYIIDWGVARVLDEPDDHVPLQNPLELSSDSHTKTGQILGTPGYMSPEQIRGIRVGPAADVYALGSILFEILAGEPLHPRGSHAFANTLAGTVVTSPQAREPSRAIPPELDAVCVAALAEDPEKRPSARELGDRIQQYLDGDRDVERRKVLAAELVAEGNAALASGDRADAVRLGGRALALDQNCEPAATLVMSLVLNPPDALPQEVEAAVTADSVASMRERSRRGTVPFLIFFATTPALLLFDIRNWASLVGVYIAFAAITVLSIINGWIRSIPIGLWLFASLALITMFTRLSGPFALTPMLLASLLLSAASLQWLVERPYALVVGTLLAVVAPFALEVVGVFEQAWRMTPDGVVSKGTIFVRGESGVLPLFFGNMLLAVVIAFYARGIGRDRLVAQRRLHAQAYYLRQLLPRRATG